MNGKPVFTVPAKTVVNFESGFKEKLLCDGPTFSAGDNCCYSCSFCYVPAQMRKRRPWMAQHGVPAGAGHMDVVVRRADAVGTVRRQLLAHPEAERRVRKVIYGSPLVDVAGNMELVRETVEICKAILELTDWDIRLLSKSHLLPKVAQALHAADPAASYGHGHSYKARVVYGVSTGTLDDRLAKAFEQGTPLVSKRIESLRWLQDSGYRTFAMVCPSLPQADYDQFAHDMATALRYDRCEHVWAEVINVRGDSFTDTHAALVAGGFAEDAARLKVVSEDRQAWEDYARATFLAHAAVVPQGKLRFLQYVTNATRPWWEGQKQSSAVVLGHAPQKDNQQKDMQL